MPSLFRRSLFLAAVAAPLLVAGRAAAQDAGTTSLGSGDFFIGVQIPAGHNLSTFDQARFFNKANCDCDTQVFVYVALTDSGFAKRALIDQTGNIEFWVGTDCGNISQRELRCLRISAPTLAAYLNDGRITIPISSRVLSTYTGGGVIVTDGGTTTTGLFTPNPDCTLPIESFDQTIYVLQTVTGSPTILATGPVHIDLTPPPEPTGVTVAGGNEAVVISWVGVDSAITTDLLGYQVLCNRAGTLQVFNDGTFAPGFLACAPPIAGADAGVINGPSDGGVIGLGSRFTCSEFLPATQRSFRVKILQNDITYGVAVVSIDRSGNASIPDIFYGTPIKTQSFYDVYRNEEPNPGAASGGLCTLGAGTTSPGIVTGLGAALAIAALVVVRRRRRR
jgi:hypothetical protein